MKKPPLFMLLVFVCIELFPADYEYENTKGSERYSSSLSLKQTGSGYSVHVNLGYAELYGIIDPNLDIVSFRCVIESDKTDLTVKKEGDSVSASGLSKGKSIDKRFRVDGTPWRQFSEIGWSDFILGNKKTFTYWVFVVYQLEMVKLVAEKGGTEKITVDGREVQAVHIIVKPEGFYSLFWHADYWFSKEDGTYLRYKACEGIGVPDTITTLKRISTTESSAHPTE
jgi:hypothetical protein